MILQIMKSYKTKRQQWYSSASSGLYHPVGEQEIRCERSSKRKHQISSQWKYLYDIDNMSLDEKKETT